MKGIGKDKYWCLYKLVGEGEKNMGIVVAVQYIRAEDLPPVTRFEEGLPASGFIKKTIEFGSFTTTLVGIADPVEDILKCFAGLKVDFSSLKLGDLSDIKK